MMQEPLPESYSRWKPFGLTKAERAMAEVMLSRMGRAVSKYDLAGYWTARTPISFKTVRVRASRVNRKLQASPYRIITHGRGETLGYEMQLKAIPAQVSKAA